MDEVRTSNTILMVITNSFNLICSSRFHSTTWGEIARGFQIVYQAMESFTACGGTYSNSSGILTSPSYPNTYQVLTDCVFLISQPSGTYVNISFIAMDIGCQGTPPDFIEVRDGKSENSPLMGNFCGNGTGIPLTMVNTQNHLRIR